MAGYSFPSFIKLITDFKFLVAIFYLSFYKYNLWSSVVNKNYYELYTNSVFNLAETMVIKSEDTAIAINAFLVAAFGGSVVNDNDPTTWKYYKNICGQYHETDTVMTVISLDTLQTIDFTTENLTQSRTTRRAYQYGSRNYIELVSLYPTQELLILGILYPAQMDKAISSPDGTILSYPKDLVEDNEASLIKNMQAWIDKFAARWRSNQFGVSDDLYTTTFLALLYVHLVPLIINLRLKACKTKEAHSFHVRQYLASHGMLDLYLDNMTRKQALFFYRNIAYIERNNGKREIFELLVEKIMTDRNLPLAEYVMQHDVSVMPNDIYANISFNKRAVNNSSNETDRKKYTLPELLAREQDLNDGNAEFSTENFDSINTSFKQSLSSVVNTKVLESSLIDYTDATPYTFHDIALSHWLYFSTNGYYSTFVSFKNPRTGVMVTIQCKDAFAYFTYCFEKALGGTPTVIHPVLANRVVRLPFQNIENVLKVADPKYVTRADAKQIIDYLPNIVKVSAVEDFYSQATKLFNAAQNQLKFAATAEHQYRRGSLQNMLAATYCDKYCELAPPGTLYTNFLLDKNLPDDEFSQQEYLDIYKQLFELCTGSLLDSSTAISSLQTAMIGLFRQLSSYSVQFIYETIGSNLKLFEHSAIRLGDRLTKTKSKYRLNDLNVEILDVDARVFHKVKVDGNSPYIDLMVKSPFRATIHVDSTVETMLADRGLRQTKRAPLSNFFLETTYKDGRIKSSNQLIGYERAGQIRQENLSDVYCDCGDGVNPMKIDLTTIIIDTYYASFIDDLITERSLDSFKFSDINGKTKAFIVDGREVFVDAFKLNAGPSDLDGFNNYPPVE
jgi:hypothetical protein